MRVLGVSLALTALLAGFGTWALGRSYHQNRTSARAEVERTAMLAGALGSTLAQTELRQLSVLASSPPFADADTAQMDAAINRISPLALGFTAVSWIDPDGAVAVQVPGPVAGLQVSDREYFRTALTGNPNISSPLVSRSSQASVVIFAVPTHDRAGAINGVLAGSLRLDVITPDLLRQLFGTDVLSVIDQTGEPVFGDPTGTSTDVVQQIIATTDVDHGLFTAPSSQVDRSAAVVGWSRVPTANWLILIARSDNEVYRAARHQLVDSSILLAAIVGLALLGGVWASLRLDRSQRSMVEVQALLQTVIEQLPAAVVVVDQSRRSRWSNPLARSTLSAINPPGDGETISAVELLEPLRRSLEEGVPSTNEDVELSTADRPRILNLSTAPVIIGGRITAATVVFEDVTEERTRERRDRELADALVNLASAEWPDQIGEIVVHQAADALDADAAALLIADGPDQTDLRALAARDDLELWRRGDHPRQDLVDRAFETGLLQSQIDIGGGSDGGSGEGGGGAPGSDHEGGSSAGRPDPVIVRWVAFPLHSVGRRSGVLLLGFDGRTAAFPSTQDVRLRGFAAQVAQALDRSERRQVEHDIALQLQRSLLEPLESTRAGLAIACRYLPADSHLEVGGDLYDVVSTPDGSTLLVIGDIVGHGLSAATAMGQLRSAVRTVATASSSPAAMLDALDQGVGMLPDCFMATLALVTIDIDSRTLTYALAGHPPPFVRQPDHTVVHLNGATSPPLGVAVRPRTEAQISLDDGDVVICMFTDGLVERRGETIVDGLERAEQALATMDSIDTDEIADRLLETAGPHRDDIAVLCAHLPPRSP